MEALAQAVAAVDALAAVDPAELDPAVLGELVVGLHRLGDRLSGVPHRAVAVQGRTAAWQGQGARSHKQWLAQRCRLSPGEAAGRARTAQRLEALPETGEALADGRIGAGHARVAAQAVRDLPRRPPKGSTGWSPITAAAWTRPVCGPPSTATPTARHPSRWPSGNVAHGRPAG